MNADGSSQTNVTNTLQSDSQPDFSPDGTRIAFTSTRPALDGTTDFDIWLMNTDGSGTPTNLTNAISINDRYPGWSPDGTKIAFWSGTGLRLDDGEIWMMNVDASNQTNLTNNPAGDIQPDWGPEPTKKK